MRTFAHLNAAVEYAIIDEDLFKLATNQSANEILIQTLLDTYFHHAAFTSKNLVKGYEDQLFSLENMILNEPSEQYAREVKALIEEERQEDVFLRGSMFKREIPKIYQNTCCISRLRVDALTSVTLIDACHIVPFSESYDDTISNGIALCPNLHRAFDRGLITIDSKYRVMVSRSFIESGEHYSIKVFDGQRIQLPVEKRHYPRLENLEWHRLNKFIS